MPIQDRQTLYRAYSAAYSKEGNQQRIVNGVDLSFLALGFLLTWADQNWPQLAALSLLWLAIREAPWFFRPDEYRRMAVRIQEQFECTYGITPSLILTGPPVPDHQVLELASHGDAEWTEDYFIDTGGLDSGKAMIARHYQTATWGEVGHNRYSRFNYITAFAASLAIGVVAYLLGGTIQRAVTQLIAPSAPFVVGRVQLGRRHRQQARARREVREMSESVAEQAATGQPPQQAIAIARSLQDRLYHERLNEGRIPQWFYRRWRDRDNRTIDVASQGIADRLKT